MNKLPKFPVAMALALLLGVGTLRAQSDPNQPNAGGQEPSDNSQQSSGAVPAFGQSSSTQQVSPFPPLSSLDEASLEPNAAPRSYLKPDFQVAEFVDTNASNAIGNQRSVFASTHLLGRFDLERFWSRYETALSYIGSGAFYTHRSVSDTQAHVLYLDQRLLWRTGVLQLRDSFTYLPEGAFGGGGFGGSGMVGGGSGGGGLGGFGGGFNFFGGSTFGGIGQQPRIGNIGIVDIQQNLSPRSSLTLAGGYGLVHFINNTAGLSDSRQVTGQAGYNYTLSRRSRVAVSYLYGGFSFPQAGAGSFNTQVVHALYGYQITGRLDLIMGAGPQYVHFNNPTLGASNHLAGSGRVSLRYRFAHASTALSYQRFVSSGSGFLSGAETDMARLNVTRPLGRKYSLFGDVGYTHNQQLQLVNAVTAHAFNSAYGGGRVTRIISRTLDAYVTAQYSDFWFDNHFCGVTGGVCARTSTRILGGIGLDWHPHIIRLD